MNMIKNRHWRGQCCRYSCRLIPKSEQFIIFFSNSSNLTSIKKLLKRKKKQVEKGNFVSDFHVFGSLSVEFGFFELFTIKNVVLHHLCSQIQIASPKKRNKWWVQWNTDQVWFIRSEQCWFLNNCDCYCAHIRRIVSFK